MNERWGLCFLLFGFPAYLLGFPLFAFSVGILSYFRRLRVFVGCVHDSLICACVYSNILLFSLVFLLCFGAVSGVLVFCVVWAIDLYGCVAYTIGMGTEALSIIF